MTKVTIRIPEDVIEDLKKVSPLLGFSEYQPLVSAYIAILNHLWKKAILKNLL
jgi:hypothetical protein